ncbi:MAG: hypothetical protein Q7S29_00545 [Candidatus Peribacter sp.]|nr:hypothetical protein [Candidatus Peribacter sp.]
MPTETPNPAPEAARTVTEEVNGILQQLKKEVAGPGSEEEKKALVKAQLSLMNREQLDDLAARVGVRQGEIPTELLDAHIGILDLVSAQRDVLKAQIEAGRAGPGQTQTPETAPSTEQKPEGWMAWAGDQMKSGAETVTGWMKKLGSWTSENAGKGWKHFVEGATATIAAIGTGFAWLREKSAQMFGSLAASVDDYLPDWLKKPLNFLMGDYGVAYKNFTKFKIEVLPNDSKQELSLQPFMEKFSMISVTGQNVSFDEYCRLVALKLRENPVNRTKIPLKITQLQLEQAADQVTQQKLNAPPPAPAAAPGTAPAAAGVAAAPGVRPAEGQAAPSPVYTFETIPEGTNLLEVPQKLRFEGHDLTLSATKDGTIKIDNVMYKLKVSKFIGVWGVGTTQWFAPDIDRLVWEQGSLSCTGNWFGFSDKKILTKDVLEKVLRNHISGNGSFENEKVSLKQVS